MDIGFTGTRDGMTPAQSRALVDILATPGRDRRYLVRLGGAGRLHHGDCRGADEQAHYLAMELGTSSRIHPPSDDRLRAYCMNHDGPHDEWEMAEPKPYHDRNRDIVDETGLLVACPKESTEQFKGGTWYTIHYAVEQGKPVDIIWPDGTVERR